MPESPDNTPDETIRLAWIVARRTCRRYGRILQPLAVGLMDELVAVTACLPAGEESAPAFAVPVEVIPYRPPGRWWPWGGRAEELAAALRKRRVHLLHALDCSVVPLTAELARRAELPFVMTCWATNDRDCFFTEPAGRAAAVIAPSEPIRRRLAARLGASGRIEVIRPGVYHAPRAGCFCEPQHDPAVVVGGPLDDFEAVRTCLDCFAELIARKRNCAFFIIGSGPAEKRLRDHCRRRGLQGHVTFADCPPTEALAGVLRSADVYIAPIRHKSIDVHTLLALAAGLPVLAADGDGADDFLIDGRTALFYAPNDAGELTVKLSVLLD
ncbi:MAG: glycosyltransferase, partial [Planctomycetes bacterium]|nr:glycosyltransferase [Planctomycetota bacterium]